MLRKLDVQPCVFKGGLNIYSFIFSTLGWFAALPRRAKQGIILSIDLFLLLQAAWIAYSLRIGMFIYWNDAVAKLVALTLPTAVILFVATGVYSTIFRYAGLGMMRRLVRTFVLYSFVITIAITVGGISGIPRTLGILQPMVFFAFVMGSRIAIRFVIVELLGRHTFDGKVKRVLIYGAGNAGQQIASSLRTEPEINVVGFVDDDKQKARQSLDGTSIWWSGDIAQIISEKKVTDIFLAIPSTSRRKRRKIVESLGAFKVIVQTLPQVRDLAEGSVSIDDVRPVEIEDLLGREPVAPDKDLLGRTVLGKTVMVTGAGGSIGSELCRQIASIGAAKLILFEISEFSLYKIERELREAHVGASNIALEIVPMLGSVTDRQRLDEAFGGHAIDTVFHAAAYKHVPLVEANPIEAIRNNIIGTQELSDAAALAKISDFILISTDKAVRPTNVMGATKRAAEQILQSHAERSKLTRFSMVRFGNVLGSSGSVVPLFRSQIAAGGPITLTHKDITRYFMTIPEAAGLVIQAAGMAKGGEMFVLDMGKPITIEKLARTMVQLSGLTVRDMGNLDGDIEIIEVGLRPGEKLFEELLIGEAPQTTRHPRIMMAHEHFAEMAVIQSLLGEMRLCREGEQAIALLKQLVPEFDHRPLGSEAPGKHSAPEAQNDGSVQQAAE